MKVIRGKMRNYGGYDFGTSLHKASMKKEPTKLMKMSRKQLKKTRERYMVSTTNTYNNHNIKGDDNVSRREKSYVKVVPRTNSLTCSSRPSNGMKSSRENIEKSMPSSSRIVRKNTEMTRFNGMRSLHENIEKFMPSSRIVRKNTEMSRPSSLKPNNGVVSSQRTTKSSLSPNTGMVCLQNDTNKSRSSSLRQDNDMDSRNKNTKGGALPLKNSEKARTCSSRLINSEASLSKNTEIPRSSSSRPSNDMVSPSMNIMKPNNVLAPLRGNNESLKSQPSRLRDGSSSVFKDDLNSMFGTSKESHPSSIFGNSRIAAQMVNGEAQKEDIPPTLETSNLSSKLKVNQANMGIIHVSSLSKNLPSCQMAEVVVTNKEQHAESMDEHIQLDSRKQNNGFSEHGGTDADKLKRTPMEPLLEEKLTIHEDDDSEEPENCRPTKRRRRLVLNDDEEDDHGDQNLADVEIGIAGSTQTAVVKDCSIKVSNLSLSESSLPIDEPVWRGIIKISSKKTVSLAAHLSTKCCEEVWKLAGSLQPEIVVTKLSRMEAWPKSFEASGPTDNNIALYFLPCQMRQDAELDQLVQEVVENDMVLQAVIGEAEMLILPSVLLPEQHQTFQRKPYLWAVFKGRKNKVATVEAQRDEMEKQQASHCSVGKEGHGVTGLNPDIGLEAQNQVEQEQNPSLARANTHSPTTKAPTTDATTSENHGQIHPSLAVPTGAFFGFVVQSNPRVELLIQEMRREGAVMVAMRGEMIGSGLVQATAAGRKEDGMTPSSS